MAIMTPRLLEILDGARSLHSATEAAQLSDISWLKSELDALGLAPDQDAVWRGRIDSLYSDVCMRLGDLEFVFEDPPATLDDREIADLELWVEGCGKRLQELWEEIETEELRFVLDYPEALLGEPHPPHLKRLAKTVRDSKHLFRRLSAVAAPSGLLDLAVALVALASRLNGSPDSADDANGVAEVAVAFFRATARAEPQASRQKLGTALVVLAQSRLATGEIEEATAAAVEASALVGSDEMPLEVLGLMDPHVR
jgi:hypothetical protein